MLVARRHLAEAGLPAELADAVDEEIDKEIEAAVEWARRLPEPAPETLYDFVSAPRAAVPEPAPAEGELFRSMDAVRLALEHELTADPSVFVAGIDVGAGGNVFGLTRGLAQAFPGRVRDTPISESAIIGTAVGAAMAGMRPVVEIMYMDFIGVALDMLLNQAAKLRFMTGGRASLPLVVRTQFGAGRSSGSQHSQSLEALLAHIPGLTVVMPSNPADTYGLLRAAIQDPNPVVFVENRLQYGFKGPRPVDGHLLPLGKAKVVREGTDVTLVSWSRMVQDCLAAAESLAAEGVSVEVVDLRTIAPLDRETVLASSPRPTAWSSRTRRYGTSASAPNSRRSPSTRGSGTWTRRSPGWRHRRCPRPTRPRWSGCGCRRRTPSRRRYGASRPCSGGVVLRTEEGPRT